MRLASKLVTEATGAVVAVAKSSAVRAEGTLRLRDRNYKSTLSFIHLSDIIAGAFKSVSKLTPKHSSDSSANIFLRNCFVI